MAMKECKKCEGLGTLECAECTDESYSFFMGTMCMSCGGAMIMPCSECKGKGKVPDENESS